MKNNPLNDRRPKISNEAYQFLRLLNMSVNELELSVRTANIFNSQKIRSISDILKHSTQDGYFIGLKKIKGAGVYVNHEIAFKLFELKIFDEAELSKIKVPKTEFPPLSQDDIEILSMKSTIDLKTRLVDLNWDWREYRMICQNTSFSIKPPDVGSRYTIEDLISQFLRADLNRDRRAVFKNWGRSFNRYSRAREEQEKGLDFVKKKFTEWNIHFFEYK